VSTVPATMAPALRRSSVILTARYSLGFALREEERDDGRLHELTVRVKAQDAQGKTRKLEVSSRRGYFMPKDEANQAAANQ
jgi:hypothetical protein